MEHLCRPGRRPLLPAAQCPAPQRLLRPARGRHQGAAAARARQGEAGAGAGHRVSECRRTGLSAGTRAACRLAVAIPGERGRARAGARHRLQRRANPERRPERPQRQLQLDGAGTDGAHPGRSGPGAAARTQLGGARPGPEHGDVGHHCNADAQRHLSRRCARPRLRRAAHVALDDPRASGAVAERADRSAEPDRLRRLRPGISHRLAPRPSAHRDGASRCRARHSGRDRRPGSGAEDRGPECEPAERLPHRSRRNGRGERQGAVVRRSGRCR